MTDSVINLSKVRFAYPGGRLVLNDLDFHLHAGERIGLVAPNGSGKTTVFHIIMGLLKPVAGTIEVFGKERRTEKDFLEVRRRIGLLFQDADDQLFSPTVLEDVAFGPLNLGKSKDDAVSTAIRTLEFLGLSGFEDRVTHKLSGGEKRLVALATVLSMEPEVLLLDEPSSGLDAVTKERLVEILNSLELTVFLFPTSSILFPRPPGISIPCRTGGSAWTRRFTCIPTIMRTFLESIPTGIEADYREHM
jgi:cobalt/nickel transport system ATP-binding protein